MCKQRLDLYKVFKLVVQKGGAAIVTNHMLWPDIVSDLGFPIENRSYLGGKLRDQ